MLCPGMYMNASYLELYQTGELQQRIVALEQKLERCSLCPRKCGVNRLKDERGFCGAGQVLRYASASPHMGEEPALVGGRGSGTIFFSYCNSRCLFCQNYQISHFALGDDISESGLAELMLDLQAQDCVNLNLVTPTHFVPQILRALLKALGEGFKLPLVYNTNGYEDLEVLELLQGVVDIYLPDMKYGTSGPGWELSGLKDYPRFNQAAVWEMYRQVGPLSLNPEQVATRGLLVRHLVLPSGLAGSEEVFRFLGQLDGNIPVSLMAQYYPCHKAFEHPQLKRRITKAEYQQAWESLTRYGLSGYVQDFEAMDDSFVPDFSREDGPFRL